MMLRIVWMLAFLAPAAGLAQAPAAGLKQAPAAKAARKTTPKPAVSAAWPIASLTVEGNHNYTKAQILAAAGLKVGQSAGKPEFEAARDRLVATGAFEVVGYHFEPAKDTNGYAASFQVTEAGPFFSVQFEGLFVKTAELDAYLKSKDPLYGPIIPATAEVMSRCAKNIEAFLGSRNQGMNIIGKVTPTGPNQFVIMFRSAAPLATIAEVRFEGNQALQNILLQGKISGVAYGFPYTEAGMRTLLDNSIRPLYEARGRAGVAFPTISTEKAKDVDGVVVTVTVDEGPELKLDKVKLAGNHAVPSAELFKLAAFKPGELVNFDEIAEGVERIKKRLRHEGYMRVQSAIERAIHEKNRTIDLTIQLDEGAQFLFGKLTVEGLDLNSEAGLRKLWGLAAGKPFREDYPDHFLTRLREDSLFDNLHNSKASVKVNEEAHTVDVTLRFQ